MKTNVFILILTVLLWSLGGCGDDGKSSSGNNDSNNLNNSNNYSNINNANNVNNANNINNAINNNTGEQNNQNNQNNLNNENNGNNTNNQTPEEWLEALCEEAPEEAVTYFMSADDSASQAQPMLAQDMIARGFCQDLQQYAPREYEFLNYYGFTYEPAEAGRLRIVPELRLGEDGQYRLLVGVVSEHRAVAERRPLHFVFSVDTSGSMTGAPFENLQHVLRALAPRMRAGDLVSLVQWSDTQSVWLEGYEVEGPNDPHFLSVVASLAPGGSTDLHAGLVTAYDLAHQFYSVDRLTRVFLVSDGGANTGITDEQLIGEAASMEEGDGIFMIGVGTSDWYNHDLMDTVTDLGRGAYVYVNNEDLAYEVFSEERFLSNVDVAALDVRLEMTLPPTFVVSEFHGEQISTDPHEVRPQHLAPNDAMLYHTFLADCGDPADAESTTLAFRVTWLDPLTREARFEELEVSLADLLGAPADHLAKADALVNYARWLAGAEVYHEPDRAAQKGLLEAELQALHGLTQDPELTAILSLLSMCD